MASPKDYDVQDVLDRVNRIKGVKGCGIVSPDGIEIMSRYRVAVPADMVSALVVSARQVAERIMTSSQCGEFRQMMIEAEDGKFFIQAVELGYLVVLADRNANIGMIRVEMAQLTPLIK